MDNKPAAHAIALATITVWGTTFIATKLLLEAFSPIEILVIRFLLGYAGLLAYSLHTYRGKKRVQTTVRQELYCAGAGISGITVYYLLENIALTHTLASNVGIIVSVAPLTTALLALPTLKDEHPNPSFFLGFAIALCGIALVLYNGSFILRIGLKGDLLALGATLGWGVYSILLRKIDSKHLPIALYTKKIFFYGLLGMVPFILHDGISLDIKDFSPSRIFLLLFLGLGASGACFMGWNHAVKILGALKTSAYIYLTPIVSLATAVVVLHEHITLAAITGCMLVLCGLVLSERGSILAAKNNRPRTLATNCPLPRHSED